jgi:hypothetical protein
MVRMTTATLLVIALSLPIATSTGRTQSAPALPTIEDLMSAKEFEAAGLRKLSVDELRALNTWLSRFAEAVAKTTSGLSINTQATTDLVESRIDGNFEGWEGETIFKLQNGQIWQQVSYAYRYHYAYAPKVLIFKSGTVYKMKVDGVSGEITVRRIN